MKIWQIIKGSGILTFLLICSIQDIREKKISLKTLYFFGGLSLIGSFLWEDITLWQRVQDLLPGGIALLLAFLTKEQIGYGDGVCLLILGNVISCMMLIRAIMIGLIFLSFCSLVLLLGKKADRKTTLPFLPFLTVGALIQAGSLIR